MILKALIIAYFAVNLTVVVVLMRSYLKSKEQLPIHFRYIRGTNRIVRVLEVQDNGVAIVSEVNNINEDNIDCDVVDYYENRFWILLSDLELRA